MKSALSLLFFTFLFAASLLTGNVSLDLSQLFVPGSQEATILLQLRVPRTLLAFLSGGILALSGLLFQTIFRNPLTTPFTLGISSGATLGASVAILTGWGAHALLGISTVELFGFLGALTTLWLIYTISRRLDSTGSNRLILAGIALSYLYGALLLLFYYMSDFEESFMITRYTMGSLLTAGMQEITIVGIGAALLLRVALHYRKALKYLSVSRDFASLQGIDVGHVTIRLFLLISLSVGMLVAITGPIGFIGLVVPHMVRLLLRRTVDGLIWPVFYFGGIFLLLCDLLSRMLPTFSPLPVGIVTSMIGGVIFIFILLKR
ncbi:MAG TPA: iron ABC transporter permease [Campylobacteraceae bacterium]|nr:iron ABC transporter permease [Campylobacteraceae bacterium]